MRSLTVPFESIVVEDFFNVSRVTLGPDASKDETESTIKDLAESIIRDGLMTDLVVMPTGLEDGRFTLVCGFRRHKAIEHIRSLNALGKLPKTARFDPNEIPVKVFDGSKEDALLLNVNENWQRRNLSRYEVGHSCLKLKQAGLKQEVIAKRTGWSQGYVSQLINIMEDVHHRILDAWREGHGACTHAFLLKMSKIPRSEQEDEWEKELKSKDWTNIKAGKRGPRGKRDKDSTKNGQLSRPSTIYVEAARDAVNTSREIPSATKDAMLKVFDYVLGRSKEIPNIFNETEYVNKSKEIEEKGREDARSIKVALDMVMANRGTPLSDAVEQAFLKQNPQLAQQFSNMKQARLDKEKAGKSSEPVAK